MLATLVAAPFDDPDWSFEVKWDGFRVETVVDGGEVRLWTRGQQDAARYFGPFLEPPTWIEARGAIVDGEVIALDDRGEPDFALLQARIKGQRGGGIATPFVYEVFDLLFLDGRSLLDEPLHERRRLLGKVLRADPRVRMSEDITGEGIAFFEAARTRGLEGIMAKDRRSTVPARQTLDGLAEGQDPARAGARRRWLGEGDRHGGRPGGAPGRRLRERGAAVRGQGRRRLHRRHPGRAARGARAAGGGGVTVRDATPTARDPDRAMASSRSSSSGRSSPAGPATAWSDRPPTRASTSERTREPSDGRRQPPEPRGTVTSPGSPRWRRRLAPATHRAPGRSRGTRSGTRSPGAAPPPRAPSSGERRRPTGG